MTTFNNRTNNINLDNNGYYIRQINMDNNLN